jgi:hypothetical protein
MLKKPKITPELIAYLTEIYPLHPPALADSDRQIWMNVGIQTVITHLKALMEQNNKRGEII